MPQAGSSDHAQKIWALWALGLLGNRGVESERGRDVGRIAAADSSIRPRPLSEALSSCARGFSTESFGKRVQDERVVTASRSPEHFLARLRGRHLRAAVAANETFVFFRELQNLHLERSIADAGDALTQLAFG